MKVQQRKKNSLEKSSTPMKTPSSRLTWRLVPLLLLLFFFTTEKTRAQDELEVLGPKWLQHQNSSNALYQHFLQTALPMLESREAKVKELKTLPEWQDRQQHLQAKLREVVGPFPARTPLKARKVKTIKKADFTVEHIVFESQPGFYVTSSLFLPASYKSPGKLPAILFCSGHSPAGYRALPYQHEILNYVKKGFVVFAFDPVGQGERFQYLDEFREELKMQSPTKQHSYPGVQAFLTGSSLAKYMIWDGMRAVDYLLTRKEVDPKRIGITGRSGGGTQSAYLAAMDERIHAAAPEAYITSFARLLQTIGPQDAEQNLNQAIAQGLDHADFLAVRAPKPALVVATTNDIFSIQGVRETVREVERIYEAYGKKDHLKLVEDLGGHQSTRLNREQKYAFFQRHLQHPGSPEDLEVEILQPEEITVTATGQVLTSLGGESVFSLNRKEAQQVAQKLQGPRKDLATHLPQAVEAARQLSGYRSPGEVGAPVYAGKVVRKDYIIEKYFLAGEGDYVIPYLLFVPKTSNSQTLLYLHPAGKRAEADSTGEVAQFVRKGYTVLVPDLIGTGEMGPGSFRGDSYFESVSYNHWFFSVLTGQSIVGLRAADIVRLTRLLQQSHPGMEVSAVAKGTMGSALLHAAAFHPRFRKLVLVEPLSSYQALVEEHSYSLDYVHHAVPGALQAYDLPDLASSLAPAQLVLVNPQRGNASPQDPQGLARDTDLIRQAYAAKGVAKNLRILNGSLHIPAVELLLQDPE
jgi:cephalosporin-C deacetylase-like acetyl esterase/pimeloyl-ACP methyl ester carboxylesterase